MSGIVCRECGARAPGDVLGLPRGWEYYSSDSRGSRADVVCPDCVRVAIERVMDALRAEARRHNHWIDEPDDEPETD